MSAAARPALRGMAPSEVLGDPKLQPISALQSMRKSAVIADGWDWFTPLALDDLAASGLFLAGPISGLPAAPTFRAINVKDLPSGTDIAQGDATPQTIVSTTLLSAIGPSFTIPSNSLTVGTILRFTASGVFGTAGLGPNLNLLLRFAAGTVTVAATGSIGMPVSLTNRGWRAEITCIVTAVGGAGAGAVEAQGVATYGTAANDGITADMENTAVVTGLSTNTNISAQMAVQWGTSNVANTITIRQFIMETMTA